MIDTTAVDVVQRFYKAMADRDLEAAGPCFAEDAVWTLPGQSSIAGTYRGWPAIRDDFLKQLGLRSGGTFKAGLLDVCAGDTYVIAVQHATAEHEGRTLDVTACQRMRIEDGRIVEVRGHYSDQRDLDNFWR
jgi:ketosteroid isomerase-like protein